MIAIAIDGPSGAGKSTMARTIAEELGFVYVDTGALYRTIGLHCVENGVDTTDEIGVTRETQNAEVKLGYEDGQQKVYLGDRDVTADIRKPEMSMAASNVSAFPAVREFLFQLQQDLADRHNVVMDGRDIGTVVLPGAQVKIFLTATPQERAHRRLAEHELRGETVDYDKLLQEIEQRDFNDSNRAIAPLKQAEDAILVDTTGMNIEQVTAALLTLIKEKLSI